MWIRLSTNQQCAIGNVSKMFFYCAPFDPSLGHACTLIETRSPFHFLLSPLLSSLIHTISIIHMFTPIILLVVHSLNYYIMSGACSSVFNQRDITHHNSCLICACIVNSLFYIHLFYIPRYNANPVITPTFWLHQS